MIRTRSGCRGAQIDRHGAAAASRTQAVCASDIQSGGARHEVEGRSTTEHETIDSEITGARGTRRDDGTVGGGDRSLDGASTPQCGPGIDENCPATGCQRAIDP